MKNKWLFISCLCVTAIVVCVACRIEYLNVKSDFFLPRPDAHVSKWVVPELDLVLEHMDNRFYERRQDSAAAIANEGGTLPVEVAPGPPYSADELRSLESMKKLHAAHSSLHWWVGSFGIAQYFLAPLALLIAVVCAVSLSGWSSKSTASLCACLNVVSIVLMLTRNYWNG